MKKILFVMPHMLCSGVERAFLSLVNEIPKDQYDITLMLVKNEGELLSEIPDDIHHSTIPIPEKISNELMEGGIKASLQASLKHFEIARFIKIAYNIIKKNPLATLTMPFSKIEPLKEKYDIAICYHMHMPFCLAYVAEKVTAEKKLAWIHNDFTESHYTVEDKKEFLKKYDHFFGVSEKVVEEFGNLAPEFREKTSVALNIISSKVVKESAEKFIPLEYKEDGYCKLLTIGRLEHRKGIDLAIEVCKMLVDNGIAVKWYVLGDGTEEEVLRKQIKELDLEESFYLLGSRENPYPYIKNCDIYVQPSRHEGFGIAVAEAKILLRPIVCTEFAGAREQLIPGKTGDIVSFDKKELFDILKKLIKNENIRNDYSENLKNVDADTIEEVNKILAYF